MSKPVRWFFLLAGLGLGGCSADQGDSGIAADRTSAPATATLRWKMVTTWPANFPVFQEGAEKFAGDVRTLSRGQLDIQVYAANELVPALQVFDAVSQGVIQMGHGASYYWAGKIPAAQFFSSVPFGMTARGMDAWLYHGGGLTLWQELYAPHGLYPIPMGNTGVQMGGWFNKRIDSVSDLKGLRMRIPGLGGKVLKRAGGNPVLIAGSEIYTALERGVIDATEWVSPFHDLRLGLHRAARYYYYPGWHEPGTNFELLINQQAWQQLSESLQHIVQIAAQANAKWIYSQMEYQNQQALQTLLQKQHIEVLPFPDAVLQELQQLTRETLEEEAQKDPDFARVLQAYQEFRRGYGQWSRMVDEQLVRYTDNPPGEAQ